MLKASKKLQSFALVGILLISEAIGFIENPTNPLTPISVQAKTTKNNKEIDIEGMDFEIFNTNLENLGFNEYGEYIINTDTDDKLIGGVVKVDAKGVHFTIKKNDKQFFSNMKRCFHLLLPTQGNKLYEIITAPNVNTQTLIMDGRKVKIKMQGVGQAGVFGNIVDIDILHAETPSTGKVVTKKSNIYINSTTKGKIVKQIKKGTTVNILRQENDHWYKVKYKNKVGYMKTQYLKTGIDFFSFRKRATSLGFDSYNNFIKSKTGEIVCDIEQGSVKFNLDYLWNIKDEKAKNMLRKSFNLLLPTKGDELYEIIYDGTQINDMVENKTTLYMDGRKVEVTTLSIGRPLYVYIYDFNKNTHNEYSRNHAY